MLRVFQYIALTVQYVERSLLLLVTAASDLPMRTMKYRSVVFGVTSSLLVISLNKIHCCVARWRLFITGDGRRISAITYIPLSKC